MPSWPHSLNRAFELAPLRTILVETRCLQKDTGLTAALFGEHLRATVEGRWADAQVELENPISQMGTVCLKGTIVGNDNGASNLCDAAGPTNQELIT